MYIFILDSRTHLHKQKHCDKVVVHNDHIEVWNYPNWEIIGNTDFTSFHTGGDSQLIRPIEKWEWQEWHNFDQCGK